MKKATLIKTISVFAIIICVILNIFLLTTDVFKGTYTNTSGDYTTKIIFYDNTYSLIKEKKHDFLDFKTEIVRTDNDFYQYIPKKAYKDAEYDTLIIGATAYKRNSVFSFSKDDEKYICGAAIFLQVLYPTIICISILLLTLYNPNKKNNKDNLKVNETTEY